jgi:multicomponent Na+:H+ antiporter subunit E
VYHCLDLAEPLVEQLYAEERLFAKALVVGKAHV